MRSITTKLFAGLMLIVCAFAFTAGAKANIVGSDASRIITYAPGTDVI